LFFDNFILEADSGEIMEQINIEFISSIPQDVKTFLKEGLTQHAIEQAGEGIKPFGFVIKEKDKIVGAITGKTFYGALYIRDLFVTPEFQKKGLGAKLMEKALAYGQENNCSFAYLETTSYHRALHFYERFGFTVDFERKGYEKNISLYYLSKKF